MIPEASKNKPPENLPGKTLLLILGTALLVRVGLMVILRSWEFPDEWRFGYEMGRMGAWLADGKGFISTWDGRSPSALFPPVYPLVVGGVFWIFGVYSKTAAIVLLLFQSACAAVSAVCLAVVGNRVGGRTAGLIAGFIWAFYPSSIIHSTTRIWYTELAVMLLLVVVTIAITSAHPPSPRRALFLGGLSGVLVLTDSTMALYLPLLLLAWMLINKISISRAVVLIGVWAVAAGVIVSPWMIRNWLVLGSPRVVKSNFGYELFAGNNPLSSGMDPDAERAQAFAALDQDELAHYRGQGEAVYNHYLQNKAFEWIRAHPFEFLNLTANRAWYFWIRNPRYGLQSWLHLMWYGPFAILALYSLWHYRRRWHLAPVWIFLLIYPLPYYVTHVAVYRYRYPVEPMVVLLGAISLSIWLSRYIRSRSATSVNFEMNLAPKRTV